MTRTQFTILMFAIMAAGAFVAFFHGLGLAAVGAFIRSRR